MKPSIVQSERDQISRLSVSSDEQTTGVRRPSYHPTPWAIVNGVLDIVDELSNGRAGWVQRFFSFAFIGGVAALINLAVFYVMYHLILPQFIPNDSAHDLVRNIVAFLFASEISLMANFIPNDYFTFRHLHAGQQRSWAARCGRFHITSISGTLLTFAIQAAFTYFAHQQAIVGQAAALIIVLFYNFSFHHLFTYRHKKPVITEPLSMEPDTLKLFAVAEVDTLKTASIESTQANSIPMF